MPNPFSWDYIQLLLADVEHKEHAFNAPAISSDFRFIGSFRLIKRVPLIKTMLITPGFPHTCFIIMHLRRYSGIFSAVHRTSWTRGQHTWFVFWRSQVQISTRRPKIEGFPDFPVPPQKFPEQYFKMYHGRFLANSFQTLMMANQKRNMLLTEN